MATTPSTQDLHAVVSCVAAVCSAFHDGAELVQQIKAKRKAQKGLQSTTRGGVGARDESSTAAAPTQTSTIELEMSLSRGEAVVRSQFDRDFKRFGEGFAVGDREFGFPICGKSIRIWGM
jgi:hypothetical protein